MNRLSALNRKLVRDLWDLRGPVFTLVIVVAGGMASFVSLMGTRDSLFESRDRYYAAYRFGDVFGRLDKAPESVSQRLATVRGVAEVHTRIVEPVRVLVRGSVQPPVGVLVSIPEETRSHLNGVKLVAGRFPRPTATTEALLLSAFASRWRVGPGDELTVIANERERLLRIVGIAESPEFVYPVGPGASGIPDDERFAVLWMPRRGVASAFGMAGAFNDFVIRLGGFAEVTSVIHDLERVVAPYGELGVVGRDLQASNYVLESELQQLRSFAAVIPAIFLAVSAMILNVVLSRLVTLQRVQIAVLKALGYPAVRIGFHFMGYALIVVVLGTVVGLGVGSWLGSLLTNLYAGYFGLPDVGFQVAPSTVVWAGAAATVAAFSGAWISVLSVVRLPAAESMRPAPPQSYRRNPLERVATLGGLAGRMAVRELTRRPIRTALSVFGIAASAGVLVVGRYGVDAMESLIQTHFFHAWREDVSVSLAGPLPVRVTGTLAGLPGVITAEPSRMVAVRFMAGPVTRDGIVVGYPARGELRRVVDQQGRVHGMPLQDGSILLTEKLGELLGAGVGDAVTFETREGARDTKTVRVAGLVDELFGLQGYMSLSALNRLLGSEPLANGVQLAVDGAPTVDLMRALEEYPSVLDASSHGALVQRFRDQSGQYVGVMTLITTLFAAAIAIGVIYNNARVALSIRQRDLASLRVLGFTRREVAGVLTAEITLQVLMAIPLGLVFGQWMARVVAASVDPERYRLPTGLSTETYAFGTIVILASALVSVLLVRSRLDRLDLIGVLKTRE